MGIKIVNNLARVACGSGFENLNGYNLRVYS